MQTVNGTIRNWKPSRSLSPESSGQEWFLVKTRKKPPQNLKENKEKRVVARKEGTIPQKISLERDLGIVAAWDRASRKDFFPNIQNASLSNHEKLGYFPPGKRTLKDLRPSFKHVSLEIENLLLGRPRGGKAGKFSETKTWSF